MSLLNRLKRFGNYKASCKCPNCGFNCEIKIPKGISVADFVKNGRCKCDCCSVIFFPDEYSTEHFEKDKLIDRNVDIKRIKRIVPDTKEDYKKLKDYKKEVGDIKWF